jgi:hypothetical protein
VERIEQRNVAGLTHLGDARRPELILGLAPDRATIAGDACRYADINSSGGGATPKLTVVYSSGISKFKRSGLRKWAIWEYLLKRSFQLGLMMIFSFAAMMGKAQAEDIQCTYGEETPAPNAIF